MVWIRVEVRPTSQEIRHRVLCQPSQARIAAADSKWAVKISLNSNQMSRQFLSPPEHMLS